MTEIALTPALSLRERVSVRGGSDALFGGRVLESCQLQNAKEILFFIVNEIKKTRGIRYLYYQ
ncbi:MAG: hypothetical protein A3G33_01245 [Omnitrophica bacterium RIFCSPLOWO2_12_FULL_44_17]|uniref:Uncharacterized protein n=1 Tax=Candidatus Danuiimicrobium aquiferis TaxID=1801832 RepID=A0A1G1L1J8_9BACT|nr:MAG: hypothetical protein A3B72_00475 [Omnitrophica bacterium RIFCSPHIGHO2_02_FULL_45_28]OGW88925.1 MAG: hypothetical protein A3E74_10365 [Omnitrophica bacterium RIFCSPHIGHO2_12_FULL_44_12]OGW99030.1 MAG: hypothetical protein A3G33_01245 [Omnitrophica bacterium RIFCSPLOWO2_12_FULL_44_17]OGX02571.1 MAG: hypothetical protein A3J12_05465 [Omnitrophica bacterium RIFCSPLOWO2_02_FULL_44_11]